MNVYRTAIDAQNGCNLSGLAHSLAEMTETIWVEARAKGEGTDYVNQHPAVVLMLAQMVMLATSTMIDGHAYNRAYAACLAAQGQ